MVLDFAAHAGIVLKILGNAPEGREDVLLRGSGLTEEIGDGAVINAGEPHHLNGADGAAPRFDMDERGSRYAKFLGDLLLAQTGIGPGLAQPLGQSSLVDGHGTTPKFVGRV